MEQNLPVRRPILQGRPSPLRPWCTPRFRFPLCFQKMFRPCRKFSQFYLFPKKNFLVIDHKFRISPLFSNFSFIFSASVHFPLFREHYYFPPTSSNFSPLFQKFTCILHALSCISFPPYFDHDAFMHHTMHVLDAPSCLGHHHQLSLELVTCTVPPSGCRRRCPIYQQAIAH